MFGDLPREHRSEVDSRLSPLVWLSQSRFKTPLRTKRLNISSKPLVL